VAIRNARYPGSCIASNNGAALFMWDCASGGPHLFTFDPHWPAVTGSIRSSYSGRCLDLPGGNATDGNLLQILTCSGATSQHWAWNENAKAIQWDGGQAGTHCLDVPGNNLTNGNSVQILQCNGSPQQQWSYDKSYSTIHLASSSDAPKCLDLQNGGSTDGTLLQIWDCSLARLHLQQWSLVRAGAVVV